MSLKNKNKSFHKKSSVCECERVSCYKSKTEKIQYNTKFCLFCFFCLNTKQQNKTKQDFSVTFFLLACVC
jgi:hypothetical protein